MTSMIDIYSILPVMIVAGWALLLLVVDLWIPRNRKGITAILAALGMAVALGFVLASSGNTMQGFSNMVVLDGFASFVQVLFLVSGMAVVALAYDYVQRMDINYGEFYVLLMFSISGMMLMSQANNLLMVFLGLELLSIPLYVLAGFARNRPESEEAALKYFLLGAFASGFVMYGIALIFSATGRLDFVGIAATVKAGSASPVLFLIGAALLLVGFGFKVAAVPFQMWTPDVYQGSPTPITAFMSVAVKAAGFAQLIRVFVVLFPSLSEHLTPILWVIAALTMIVGNVVALAQNNIKRMLAYSAIAHAGYMLMAFVAFGNSEVVGNSVAATLFYLVAYGITSLGAWGLVIVIEREYGRGILLDDLAGIGKKYPWLGVAMLIFMLSFTGVPLTMGFWGKFFLFRSAVQAGFIGLAVIGLLSSVASAYYYLRVVVYMFMKPGEPKLQINPWVSLIIGVAALAVLLLSLMPWTILDLASRAMILLQ